MAKYKFYSYAQGKFIPIFFDKQIMPGTFEFTLNHIIDNELDLSVFNERFSNDETGAPAYDPKILLKIILFAYSRGIISSRKIAQACEENIIFMALSGDTRPHFTTIADFVWHAPGYRRTALCQYQVSHRARSFYTLKQAQGRRPVEAILHCP